MGSGRKKEGVGWVRVPCLQDLKDLGFMMGGALFGKILHTMAAIN